METKCWNKRPPLLMTHYKGSSRTNVTLQLLWVWLAKICFSHHQGDISFWPDGCTPCRFVHSHIQVDKKYLQNSIQEYSVWHFYTEICVWEDWWRSNLNSMQSSVYVISILTTIKMLLLVHLEISLLRWPLEARIVQFALRLCLCVLCGLQQMDISSPNRINLLILVKGSQFVFHGVWTKCLYILR